MGNVPRASRAAASLLLLAVLAVLTGWADEAGGAVPCAEPMAVLRDLYDSNDAGLFDKSALSFTDDAELATWASGVNGYIMAKRILEGREQIRGYLAAGRGLARRLPGSPADGPLYREARVSISGDTVRFMLEPDRKRPNGKQYNPFSVEAVLLGCRIRSLTVIEQVTWL